MYVRVCVYVLETCLYIKYTVKIEIVLLGMWQGLDI